MVVYQTVWTFGIAIGLPSAIAAICILIGVGVLFFQGANRNVAGMRHARQKSIGGLCLGLAVVVGCVTAALLYPFKREFHEYQPVYGIVTSVDTRFIQGGQQRFVLWVNGDRYAIDDYRAATVRPGYYVNLLCIREWQWVGTPKNICYWNQ